MFLFPTKKSIIFLLSLLRGNSISFLNFVEGFIDGKKGVTILYSSTLFLSSSQIARKGKNTKKECIAILELKENSNKRFLVLEDLNINPVNL